MASFAVVLLAAGASSRYGRPKQLLPYLGGTLVEHASRTALDSGAARVVVVVGAEADAVREALLGLGLGLVVVENRDWAEGMGSSIRCGIAAVGDVDAAVIALADQPKITSDHLRALAAAVAETGQAIVASSYEGVVGAPCAFARSEFSRLAALSGDAGARSLIRSANAPIQTISFEGALLDVDTPAHYLAAVDAPEPRSS